MNFQISDSYSDYGILAPPPHVLRLKGQALGDPPARKQESFVHVLAHALPYSCNPFAVNHALTENVNYRVYMQIKCKI